MWIERKKEKDGAMEGSEMVLMVVVSRQKRRETKWKPYVVWDEKFHRANHRKNSHTIHRLDYCIDLFFR